MNLPGANPPDHGSGEPADPPPGSPDAAARRRRLDEVFGDVLPDVTGDEQGTAGSTDERWYQENRPPHHG